MFEIAPRKLEDVLSDIGHHDELLQHLGSMLSFHGHQIETAPSGVQLSHNELPGEQVDQLLGYAGIPQSNGPIGLPFNFEPFTIDQGQYLLYPLNGLEEHVRRVAADVASAFDRAGSMDVLASGNDDMTAREYLVGGVLDCIRFCKENGWALVIHW